MSRRSQIGVGLLELVIVVTIILIISAISIPNLLRARQHAYEASAAGFLHTVQTEQIAYRAVHGSYATSFSQLPGIAALAAQTASGGSAESGATVIIDSAAGGATSTIIRNSYIYTMKRVNEEQWNIYASPVLDRRWGEYWYLDETGALRSAKGALPTITSGFAQ